MLLTCITNTAQYASYLYNKHIHIDRLNMIILQQADSI